MTEQQQEQKTQYYYVVEYDLYGGESPRENDNLGVMCLRHNRYNLPWECPVNQNYPTYTCRERDYVTGQYYQQEYEVNNWSEMESALYQAEHNQGDDIAIILPVFMYEHSGVALNTGGFYDPWDSGQVGFIYITYDKIKEEYGYKKLTVARRAKIEELLNGEVKEYGSYLNGEVYYIQIRDAENNEVESYGGLIGSDWIDDNVQSEYPGAIKLENWRELEEMEEDEAES